MSAILKIADISLDTLRRLRHQSAVEYLPVCYINNR